MSSSPTSQFHPLHALTLSFFLLATSSCGSEEEALPVREGYCAPETLTQLAGTEGTAYAFTPDPIVASGSSYLSPSSSTLANYASTVTLTHLTGFGVLQGTEVEVRDMLNCEGRFGAYSTTQDFRIDHDDPAFQQANAYAAGDQFFSMLKEAGAKEPSETFTILAPCLEEDNAFYVRSSDSTGETSHTVCLGNSVTTPGAYYADDSMVTVHEIQHGITANAYSESIEFNQFFFDMAGSANEGISDFLALIQFAEETPESLDRRIFSRWALGTFEAGSNSARGAHFCPMYDSRFASGCSGSVGVTTSGVDYTFPRGLGWPFSNSTYSTVTQAFKLYRGVEEIHNAGLVLTGALFDAYEAVVGANGGNQHAAKLFMTKAVMDALEDLGSTHLPSNASLSPVTFMDIAEAVIANATAAQSTYGSAVASALASRGLDPTATPVANTWLSAPSAPGGATCTSLSASPTGSARECVARVKRKSDRLREWMSNMGGNATIPTNTLEASGALQKGEISVVWFNLKNLLTTVGEVEVTISSDDPDVSILGSSYNIGARTTIGSTRSAQVQYLRVYGSDMTSNLDGEAGAETGHYFKSNYQFDNDSIGYMTGLWVQTSSLASGSSTTFQVTARASNSTLQSTPVDFTIPYSN